MKWFILFSLFSCSVIAGVEAFLSPSRQKLFLEEGAGPDTYFVKFSGVKSAWSDKPIKVTRSKRTGDQYVYAFNYVLELSNGKHDRTYQILTDEGSELASGSRVRRVKLWTPENARDGVVFVYDKGLTEDSQNLKLEAEHKKSAFTPEVP